MIYLTAIGFTSGGSSTGHIYTQIIHRIQGTEHNITIKKLNILREPPKELPLLANKMKQCYQYIGSMFITLSLS
jgi:hypothetical protein